MYAHLPTPGTDAHKRTQEEESDFEDGNEVIDEELPDEDDCEVSERGC